MNRLVNAFRRAFGVPYWSLSQWAKLKVKNASITSAPSNRRWPPRRGVTAPTA